jgi:hypothetical protein
MHSIVGQTMDGIIHRAQVKGAFQGFNQDALFSCTDGSHWLQTEYKYWYHYAYRPMVEIFLDRGRACLRLKGCDESVPVRQLFGVVLSEIAGGL